MSCTNREIWRWLDNSGESPAHPPRIEECSRTGNNDHLVCLGWAGDDVLLYTQEKQECALTKHHALTAGHFTETRKPEVNLFYNSTKGGVDVVDQMIDCYRSKVDGNRWPMVVFNTILDIGALNAFIIWILRNPAWKANLGSTDEGIASINMRSFMLGWWKTANQLTEW